jgi:hypothetical protein
MVDDPYLGAVEARAAEASGKRWELASRSAGKEPSIVVHLEDGTVEHMRVTRDLDAASEADVRFIAHCRSDIETLVAAARGAAAIATPDLDAIEQRARSASPAPWTAYIEAEGGLAGSDVIRVSDRDDEPDMYLWLGSRRAPSADYRFVAAARQDVARLLDTLKYQA